MMVRRSEISSHRWNLKTIWIFELRAILTACSFLFKASKGLVARWSFEKTGNTATPDSVSDTEDAIGGSFQSVPGVSGKALRFDGYTTSVRVASEQAPKLGQAFSVEAWVALNTYPWNWVRSSIRKKTTAQVTFSGLMRSVT
jgi:hypothetical protein